jgi:hypothetical protein
MNHPPLIDDGPVASAAAGPAVVILTTGAGPHRLARGLETRRRFRYLLGHVLLRLVPVEVKRMSRPKKAARAAKAPHNGSLARKSEAQPQGPTLLRLPDRAGAAAEDAPREGRAPGLVEFLWKVHDSLEQSIRFADSKAALVIVAASGLLSALYAARVHVRFLVASRVEVLPALWASTAFLLLGCGVCLAAWAIVPRFRKRPLPGLLFWESILAHGEPDQFRAALARREPHDFDAALLDDLFRLAKVCRLKYWYVRWSMYLTFAGGSGGAVLVLFAS